jgi:hypothetical protein
MSGLMIYTTHIIRVIKWSRMRWAGHVVRMGMTRDAYRVLAEKREGKRPLWKTQK